MVSAIFLLQLLLRTSFSQNISGGAEKDFETTSSIAVTVVNKSDSNKTKVQSMIQTQAELCPYVQLCTFKNISTASFTVTVSNEYPCCSDCSCNLSCIEQGTCCPDFDNETYQLNTKTARLQKSETAEGAAEELGCVKTHYGIKNRNKAGYKMIVTCPSNFTDVATKERCEKTFLMEDVNTFGDVIPVFDKESSRSYKNIFCYLCNRAADGKDTVTFNSTAFWDIRAYCFSDFQHMLYFQVDSLYFAKSLFQHRCNIVFINIDDADDESKACEVDDVIDTCNTEHVASELETLCKEYTWPISTQRHSEIKTYNNYACMLCNGKSPESHCTHYSSEKSKSTIFLEKTDSSSAIATFIGKNQTGRSSGPSSVRSQTIDRFFPDSKGNVLCDKGFIFDDEKKVCRQVFCPLNFFLKDATCVPMFQKTEGMFYYHLFEVVLPASVDGEDTKAVEAALVLGIGEILQQRAGTGNYNLSLWCDEQSHGKLIRNRRKYIVLLVLDCNYSDGKYVEFLQLFYAVVVLRHRVVLNEIKGKSEIRLHFTKDYRLQHSIFVSVSGRQLYLVYSKTLSINSYPFSEMAKILAVTISHICYRVGLYSPEITNAHSRGALLVKRTHQIIPLPNFQRYNLGKEIALLVCLEHALNGVAETNKYIFDNIPPKITFHKEFKIINDRGDGEVNESTTMNHVGHTKRSIIATVSTAVVVLLVIGIRMLLIRLKNRRL